MVPLSQEARRCQDSVNRVGQVEEVRAMGRRSLAFVAVFALALTGLFLAPSRLGAPLSAASPVASPASSPAVPPPASPAASPAVTSPTPNLLATVQAQL